MRLFKRNAILQALSNGLSHQSNAMAIAGSQIFTSSGVFVVPIGVTSVCAVVVSGGKRGSTGSTGTGSGTGGNGGGLAYKNNILVTPGQSYSVVVSNDDNNPISYFISQSTVSATPISIIGDGGGLGGSGGRGGGGSGYHGGGGGGAGGYAGNGGSGGVYNKSSTIPSGSADAGSGGASGGTKGRGGGGVGLFGIGVTGFGASGGGIGGSGGGNGNDSGQGGLYGGGGAGGYGTSGSGYLGGGGAVRIIWGFGKNFPNNAS